MEQQVSNVTMLFREICEEERIHLTSYSDNWAHRLEKDGKTAFIVGYQFGLSAVVVIV